MLSLNTQNLQWPLLLEKLAGYTQSERGRELALSLPLDLDRATIESRWTQVEPLRDLVRSGYRPPIGDLPRMEAYFKAARLGQILDGESLRSILTLLLTVKQIHRFTTDFKERCTTLVRFHSTIYPLPKLSQAIEKSISPEGEVLDDASPELKRIRSAKIAMRKKIEHQIRQLLIDQELETYIQDKFFTLRAERYVIPIRLDGRGRVKGSIYDTSDSGQTLYIEPTAIAPLNEQLLELELSEKLEILRIFRELSAHVASELEVLKGNYDGLVELDFLASQASLAHEIDAVKVRIAAEPTVCLVGARHPLVRSQTGATAVPNDILLEPGQNALIVSGPNAGGKTVVLKTVGLLHLMAKAGLLIPASPESAVFLFSDIFLEMGDAQNLTANLSTFSGHLLGLKPILEKAGARDLVLLDEVAVGTEPHTGAAIAQSVLEHLAERGALSIVTTHFDTLKGMAVTDHRFRNGSMEFSTKNLKPTYKLVLDLPGQSYGLEVAEQLGLPEGVIRRAKQLKGTTGTSLDSLVESLVAAREEARNETALLKQQRLATEAQKSYWETERRALEEARQKSAQKVASRIEDEVDSLRVELRDTVGQLKEALKKAQRGELTDVAALRETIKTGRRAGEEQLGDLDRTLDRLEANYEPKKTIPGRPCQPEELEPGASVYIVSLGKTGTVVKIHDSTPPSAEVQVGLLKVRPPVQELRLIDAKPAEAPAKSKKAAGSGGAQRSGKNDGRGGGEEVGFVVPTLTNSLDVRGLDANTAIERVWEFVDRAVMRGEPNLIVIHGHGTAVLKKAVRTALARQSPYQLDFRPGEDGEGGDGVTVIHLGS